MVNKSRKKLKNKRRRILPPSPPQSRPVNSTILLENDGKEDESVSKQELTSPHKVLIASCNEFANSISDMRSVSPTTIFLEYAYANEEFGTSVNDDFEDMDVTTLDDLDASMEQDSSAESVEIPVDPVRSDSSGTDTAEMDDMGILTLEPDLVSNPELVQYIKIDRSPVLIFDDDSEHKVSDDSEETRSEVPDFESRPLSMTRRTYGSSRKRSSSRNNTTTILKRSFELPTPAETTLGCDRRRMEINRMQLVKHVQALERSLQVSCLADKCKKTASVSCPSCKKLVYCTERHRKIYKKQHEPHCFSYRMIENKSLGVHMIAAKDIVRAIMVMCDEPTLILPMNPSLESRTFPHTYCLNCFTNNDGPTYRTKAGCPGCHLPTCGEKNCAPVSYKYLRGNHLDVVAHIDADACKVLSPGYNRIHKHYFLILDQSVVGLLRCLRLPNSRKSELDAFMELMNRIQLGPYTKNFESKLQLIRSLFFVDGSVVSDEQLYRLDQALTRYGRNIGPASVAQFETTTIRSINARCFYPTLVHMSHSCVPNCLLLVSRGLMVEVHSGKFVKKGEMFSICYDERVLFCPTVDRRRYLFREFGILCKCKRCISPSELGTYFSSYPCSWCSGFLNAVNPIDDYTNWLCHRCKKTSVSYLRVIDTNLNFKGELENPIRERDVYGLLNLMTELVSENYLHWNHHIIFHASIKLCSILWEEFINSNLKIIRNFSKTRGLEFLKPVDSVLNISLAFMPDGYDFRFVIPIRLAALIKLRHLTEQLKSHEITSAKLNGDVNEIYFRGYDISKRPLFELWATPDDEDDKMTAEAKMQELESKVLEDLVQSVMIGQNDKSLSDVANAVYKMNCSNKQSRACRQKKTSKEDHTAIFPWKMNM